MDKRSNQILNQLLAGGRLQLAEILKNIRFLSGLCAKRVRELNDELNEMRTMPSVSINGRGNFKV